MKVMKQGAYYISFGALGFLVATLIHAGLELPYLMWLTADYGVRQGNVVWQNWEVIHDGGAPLLWVISAAIGLALGQRYWKMIYIEKRFGEPHW